MAGDTLQFAYILPFSLAAVACLVGLLPAGRIRHRATGRGLAGLLVLSAAWAALEGGRILITDPTLGRVVYGGGLVVGFGTVFAWLYFVSAYTGSGYHTDPRVRRAALGGYLAVVTLKLTNPIHGAYFTASRAVEPFPHIVVSYGVLNWMVLSIAYVLSGLGFLALFRFFAESPWNTRTLTVLVATTALPVVGTVAGRLTDPETLLALSYEPLGVAVFALGSVFVVLDSFRATLGEYGHGIDQITDAVIVCDESGIVRRQNATASEAFPDLAAGQRLADRLPKIATALESDPRQVVVDDRRWLCRESSVSLGPHRVGSLLVLTDVTALRRQQAELSRQNRQLEQFAEAITHELRNGVAITDGHLGRAGRALSDHEPSNDTQEVDSTPVADDPQGADDTQNAPDTETVTLDRETVRTVIDSIEAARTGVSRTERIVDDLATLTRLGQTVRAREHESCSLAAAAHAVGAGRTLSVVVTTDATIQAEPIRLERLFDRAATFAAANGASRLVVTPTRDGFAVAGDGRRLDSADSDGLFEYGDAVPSAETGMLLPMVRSLARVHGWEVELDASYRDGIRYVVTDATTDLTTLPGSDAQSASETAPADDTEATNL